MYHIPKDKRAKKSARLICYGLSECLKAKEMAQVTVSDIYRTSSVSRSTFYRLFDNATDVLAYQCDLLFEEAIEHYSNGVHSTREYILVFIEVCLKHRTLIEAVSRSNRIDLLYNAHLKYSDSIKGAIFRNQSEAASQMKYILSFLTSAVISVIMTMQTDRSADSPEEIYEHCKSSIQFLNNALE